jgi:hypothetical protein
MAHEVKASEERLSYLLPGMLPEEKDQPECEVCGATPCECPPPVAECCACGVLLYEGDEWSHDREGDPWCSRCYPGGNPDDAF